MSAHTPLIRTQMRLICWFARNSKKLNSLCFFFKKIQCRMMHHCLIYPFTWSISIKQCMEVIQVHTTLKEGNCTSDRMHYYVRSTLFTQIVECIITLGQHYMYKWHLYYYMLYKNATWPQITPFYSSQKRKITPFYILLKFSQIYLRTKHAMLLL